MFQTYWRNDEMYRSKFENGWYITGDRARVDEDGYFWFVGRADDVINTAGHLVGPFEVESALVEHPAVAEAGVIGKPDPIAMEIVKAFVALREGYEPSTELRNEIMRFVRGEALARHRAPRDRFSPQPAQDPQRQDHAPPAQGPRARPARGRHVDPRGRLDTCVIPVPRLAGGPERRSLAELPRPGTGETPLYNWLRP